MLCRFEQPKDLPQLAHPLVPPKALRFLKSKGRVVNVDRLSKDLVAKTGLTAGREGIVIMYLFVKLEYFALLSRSARWGNGGLERRTSRMQTSVMLALSSR